MFGILNSATISREIPALYALNHEYNHGTLVIVRKNQNNKLDEILVLEI